MSGIKKLAHFFSINNFLILIDCNLLAHFVRYVAKMVSNVLIWHLTQTGSTESLLEVVELGYEE